MRAYSTLVVQEALLRAFCSSYCFLHLDTFGSFTFRVLLSILRVGSIRRREDRRGSRIVYAAHCCCCCCFGFDRFVGVFAPSCSCTLMARHGLATTVFVSSCLLIHGVQNDEFTCLVAHTVKQRCVSRYFSDLAVSRLFVVVLFPVPPLYSVHLS